MTDIERADESVPDIAEDHAKTDLAYVEGLQAHLDEGGQVSAGNAGDLILMVKWNATHAINLSKAIEYERTRAAKLVDAIREVSDLCDKKVQELNERDPNEFERVISTILASIRDRLMLALPEREQGE